jgi:hypothetical protein
MKGRIVLIEIDEDEDSEMEYFLVSWEPGPCSHCRLSNINQMCMIRSGVMTFRVYCDFCDKTTPYMDNSHEPIIYWEQLNDRPTHLGIIDYFN